MKIHIFLIPSRFVYCNFFASIESTNINVKIKRIQRNFFLQNFDNPDQTIYVNFFTFISLDHSHSRFPCFPSYLLIRNFIFVSFSVTRPSLTGAAVEQRVERADWEANHALLSITLIKT